MRSNKCAFCEEYKKQIEISKMERDLGYFTKLRACIFVRSTKGYGTEHYSMYSKPMRLRYCPSCGKEL